MKYGAFLSIFLETNPINSNIVLYCTNPINNNIVLLILLTHDYREPYGYSWGLETNINISEGRGHIWPHCTRLHGKLHRKVAAWEARAGTPGRVRLSWLRRTQPKAEPGRFSSGKPTSFEDISRPYEKCISEIQHSLYSSFGFVLN